MSVRLHVERAQPQRRPRPVELRVEVASSHAGMGAEISAYIAIADALRSFWPRP